MEIPSPLTLIVAVAVFALVPIAITMLTSFVKLAVVLMLLRNALGVQQIPPNIAIYGICVILTAYIMAPVVIEARQVFTEQGLDIHDLPTIVASAEELLQPFKGFLRKHVDPLQVEFFVNSASHLWGPDHSITPDPDGYLILIPAFVTTELTNAFEIGFLVYLPFIAIDLIVSNLLLAMGMMMVSPVTISLPLKLFLFVMIDGWSRLIHGLVLTY